MFCIFINNPIKLSSQSWPPVALATAAHSSGFACDKSFPDSAAAVVDLWPEAAGILVGWSHVWAAAVEFSLSERLVPFRWGAFYFVEPLKASETIVY